MPPIRRTTRLNTPQRRPKVAGTSGRPDVADAAEKPGATVGEPTAVEARAAETVAAAVAEPSPAEPEPSPAEPEPSLAEPEPSPAEGNADGPTVETGPDAALVEGEGVGVASSGARGARLSWRLVAVLGAAAVVVGAFAAVAAFRPGAQVSNTAYVDIATTSEVTDAARSALIALSEYSPDAIDQYPDKARAVLTEKMRGEFDKTVDTTVSAVKQSGTSTTAEVSDVGVKVLDGDRAELIANMTVSAEMNGVAQDGVSGPLIVQMEKVDGVWLLSDIADQ